MTKEIIMYDDLFDAIDECAERLGQQGYAGNEGVVLDLIERCQKAIEQRKGQLGPWERSLLDHARAAASVRWLKLALTAADKALQVSDLPQDEYEYGYKYGRTNP